MKLYIVSDGSYSDYHILGIFSTREKADAAKVLYNADNDVEDDWELDKIPDHPPGLLPYYALIDREGNAMAKRCGAPEVDWADPWSPYGDDRQIVCRMWAADEQHAVKIANDLRARLIATGEWELDHNVWWAQRRAAEASSGVRFDL